MVKGFNRKLLATRMSRQKEEIMVERTSFGVFETGGGLTNMEMKELRRLAQLDAAERLFLIVDNKEEKENV